MGNLLSSVSLGSSYYPPHHDRTDWERDVQRMVAAGLNTIRTAELLASWDKIEMIRNQPDWSWLDEIFKLAEKYGLNILLGTGSPSPPIWITELYEHTQVISRDGVPYPTATVWGWACKKNPGYRAEVNRYLGLLIERYGQHPALLGWQIDNEPGFPLLKRVGAGNIDHYCYCPNCTQGFRDWLKKKYSEIGNLNEAWRWDCTHHQYYDWHLVSPPRSMPIEWGGVTHWLDWRDYQYDNLAEFIKLQHDQIKAALPDSPTMTNIFCFSGREIMMAMDGDRLAKVVDAIGYDLYPGIHQESSEYIPLYLDFASSNARRHGRDFWIAELESGPVGGWVLGPDHDTSANDILRYNLSCLSRGARMILYQGYREWNCIPIHWGALVDFHGEPTPRYEAAAKIDRMVQQHQAFFQHAQPTPAKIALIYDIRNHTAVHGMDAAQHQMLAIQGCYGALWAQGYRVDFTTPEEIRQGEHGYDVLLMPFLMQVDMPTANALKAFVQRGGTLVAFAKGAMLDHRGWSHNDRPGAGLAEVFGVLETHVRKAQQPDLLITMDDGSNALGYWHQQFLKVQDGAQVIGTFPDGTPALVQNTYGQGRAFYAATHLDMAHALQPDAALRKVFARFVGEKIQPDVMVKAVDGRDIAMTVSASLLHHGQRKAVIVTNNSPHEVEISLNFEGRTASWQEVLSGQEWQWGSIKVEPFGGLCLLENL